MENNEESNFKEISKEELASRRSSAYEYYDFKDKESNKIMYSEEEVKELFQKLVNQFSLHRGMMIAEVLPKWFEENKKK